MASSKYAYYRQPDIIAQFEPLRSKLSLSITIDHTAKELAKFTEKLVGFQHAVLGSPNKTRPFVRIPHKLFKDFNLDGALYTVLKIAFTWRMDHGVKRWDLENPTKRDTYIGLLRVIVEGLVREGFVKYPCIAFGKSLGEDVREELVELAPLVQATIVPYMTPSVTHILQESPEHETAATTTEQEWYRTLEKRNGYVLLHYWYKPDSADVWMPESSGDYLDPEPAPEHQGPWRLSVRWLRDSVANNEWMNEEDYEAENPEPPDDGEDDDQEDEEDDDEDDDEEDDDDDDDEEEEEEEEEEIEDEEEDDMSDVSIEGDMDGQDNQPPKPTPNTPLEPTPKALPIPITTPIDLDRKGIRAKKYEYEPIPNGILSNISQTIQPCMPSGTLLSQTATPAQQWDFTTETSPTDLATWTILHHPNAPWFSMESIHPIEYDALPTFRTRPTEYKTIRNGIITAYTRRMDRYLPIAECSERLGVPVLDICPVHRFLGYWGLIHSRVRQGEPTGLTRLYAGFQPLLDTDTTVYTPHTTHHPSRTCHTCQTELCTYMLVHPPHVLFCEDCYLMGKYPFDVSSKDFVRVAGDRLLARGEWTDMDRSLVLDGMDGIESWESVSKKVGKSVQECFLEGLRMVDDDGRGWFRDVGNPVLVLLGVLEQVVSPGVAACAAKAALSVLNTEKIEVDVMVDAALEAAVQSAKQCAEYEEKEVEILVRALVECQVRKVELKVGWVTEMDS
ncbi:uncharacterized protein SPPG_01114 [Spizellomyces punctatus DAOM BR117]|uniref:Uncharacterized protein n=1 Tax=Spizellomyces punctatus (strain DAOM BR117) TaxID=645134 RepID=A0A0L0HQH7_SPIPD|nr:uncharacterized protein SPPG_01114 [Spizellomyces punctatus DAOM BR117]KND03641.1 hypothetical protein SPPG_01114 [Spizellomyces punctatus DAOM BR117]|eukprot:XP_016611680.1 hypothetical protein SPPG_01114 [Spizellomyces punctatus DAOM BR117]